MWVKVIKDRFRRKNGGKDHTVTVGNAEQKVKDITSEEVCYNGHDSPTPAYDDDTSVMDSYFVNNDRSSNRKSAPTGLEEGRTSRPSSIYRSATQMIQVLNNSQNIIPTLLKSMKIKRRNTDELTSSKTGMLYLADVLSKSSDITNYTIVVNPTLPPDMQRHVWRLQDFHIIKLLHYVQYCHVGVYKCKLSGRNVVLKTYSKRIGAFKIYQVDREIQIQVHQDHPNLIKLYCAFVDCDSIILVQEYFHGTNLLDYMEALDVIKLPEAYVRDIIAPQLLSAVEHLHDRSIIHRDIKPINILISGNDEVKLCDFGISIDLAEEAAVTHCGTSYYMAPEVARCPLKHNVRDHKFDLTLHYTTKSDIWSIGVICYELLVGMKPAFVSDYMPIPKYLKLMSLDAVDFITACLNRCAVLRPDAAQLKESAWLKQKL